MEWGCGDVGCGVDRGGGELLAEPLGIAPLRGTIYIPSRARGRACVPFGVHKALVEFGQNGLFRGIKGAK